MTTSTVGTADEQTQAGWFVPDLAAELAELRSSGVEIQEYDTPELRTVDGVTDLGFRGRRVDRRSAWEWARDPAAEELI